MWSIALAFLAATAGQIDPAEQMALKSRRSIPSGEVKIRSVDYVIQGDNDEAVVERTVEYKLEFKGEKLRTLQSAGQTSDDGSLAIFAKEEGLCVDGQLYRHDFNLAQPDEATAIPVATIEDSETWLSLRKHVVDPRLFGIQPVPFGILHSCSYEEFLANPHRTETSTEEATVSGMPVRLVTVKRPGVICRMWIAPDQGWNLLKSEVVETGGQRAMLENRLTRFGETWFPQEVLYLEYNSQQKLVDKNIATVLSANFDSEIPDSRFTLASLNPAKGTMVFNAAKPSQVIGRWDGDTLIPFGQRSRTNRGLPPPLDRKTGSHMTYVYLANLIGGVAILILLFVRKSKSKA